MPDTSRLDPQELLGLVESWFFESFHGSAVARDTASWNTAHAAKEELKRRLAEYVADHSHD